MPMQRWIASAAGGTSQRLKPGLATVAARSSQPARPAPRRSSRRHEKPPFMQHGRFSGQLVAICCFQFQHSKARARQSSLSAIALR